MKKLQRWTNSQLFRSYISILDELRRRGIVRSANSPVADYAEVLVCHALDLKRELPSTKGYDAKDRRNRRYEIKGRRITIQNKSRQLSAIRDLESLHFDYLVVVLFNADFSLLRGGVIPVGQITTSAQYRKHDNAWILHARDTLFEKPGVRDITDRIRNTPSFVH